MIEREYYIDRANILNDLTMLSSMIGRDCYDGEGNSLYDVIKITEQDVDFLNNSLDDCLTILKGIVKEYYIGMTSDSIRLAMPVEFSDGLYKQFIHSANDMLKNYVMWQWLLHTEVAQSKAAVYQAKYEQDIHNVTNSLYMRVKPILPSLREQRIRLVVRVEDLLFAVRANTDRLFNMNEGTQPVNRLNAIRYESSSVNEGLFYSMLRKYDGVVRGRMRAYLVAERPDRHCPPHHHHGHHGHGHPRYVELNSGVRIQDELVYDLVMPEHWDNTQEGRLMVSVSDYLSNILTWEFLKNAPEEAVAYKSFADESFRDIKSCLMSRTHSEHRPRINVEVI
jgi:hypothetical protein